ncbi:MAG TPA: hypothetical protein VGF45_14395 [Polyangia bacterium]
MSPPAPPPSTLEPSPEELHALADKYRTLLGWRQRRDADQPAPERASLRALAERYPGALRELDTLGEAELARRAAAAASAAQGGPCEAWMAWILALHRLLAAALYLKRESRVSGADVKGESLRPTAESLARMPLSDELMRALIEPPGGRITPVALTAIAVHFGQPPALVAATLLPSRRRPA